MIKNDQLTNRLKDLKNKTDLAYRRLILNPNNEYEIGSQIKLWSLVMSI